MHHTPTSANAPVRQRVSRALVLASLLALAACGSSGGGATGSDIAEPTTTASDATGEKGATTTTTSTTTTTTEVGPVEAKPTTKTGGSGEGMPVGVDDAPSGDWIMVRWQTGQDPEPEGFVAGQAEVRLYDIEPTCDDEGCDLTLKPGGEENSYALPDLAPLTGEPIEIQAGGEAWTSSEAEQPYGCTAELDGPYVESQSDRALAPVRDSDGAIIAMVGPATFTDTVNDAGRAAGCPTSSKATYEYESVMVDTDVLREAPTFDVVADFRQTLEVVESAGYTEERLKAGGLNVGQPDFDHTLEGSCDEGECSVDLSVPTGKTTQRDLELTATDGRTLAAEFDDEAGCYDPATGDIVFEDGAYSDVGGYTDLVPIWVVDGEAQIFLGRYQSTGTPTELGKTDPACSTPEALEGWVTWIDTDLIDS